MVANAHASSEKSHWHALMTYTNLTSLTSNIKSKEILQFLSWPYLPKIHIY